MTTPETEPVTPAEETAPPIRRRHTRRLVRYFLAQLFPVTAGILLALLIDGLLEGRRQDRLVSQAQAALTAEIRNNAGQLEISLPSMDAFLASLTKHMADLDAILATGTDPGGRPSFGMVLPNLTRASWDSAERTGALEYMDYDQVQRYAALYANQESVLSGQNDLSRRFPTLGPVGTLLADAKAAAHPDELRDARKPIAELMVAIGSHRVMVQGLLYRYRKMPCSPEPCAPQSAAPAR
jgi:hypothetical protein